MHIQFSHAYEYCTGVGHFHAFCPNTYPNNQFSLQAYMHLRILGVSLWTCCYMASLRFCTNLLKFLSSRTPATHWLYQSINLMSCGCILSIYSKCIMRLTIRLAEQKNTYRSCLILVYCDVSMEFCLLHNQIAAYVVMVCKGESFQNELWHFYPKFDWVQSDV